MHPGGYRSNPLIFQRRAAVTHCPAEASSAGQCVGGGLSGARAAPVARALDILLGDDVGFIYLKDAAELADIHAGATVNAQIWINGVDTVHHRNGIAWTGVHAAIASGASIGIDYEHESLFIRSIVTMVGRPLGVQRSLRRGGFWPRVRGGFQPRARGRNLNTMQLSSWRVRPGQR